MALAIYQLGQKKTEHKVRFVPHIASFPSLTLLASPAHLPSYLGLTLQSPKESLVTLLTQEPKAHVGHSLHWLPIDIPATTESGKRVGEGSRK